MFSIKIKLNLYGPAAIQAPSPLSMLAREPMKMVKDNSEPVSAMEFIQGLLAMTKGEGRYFENALNTTQQEHFVEVLALPASKATNRAAERLYKNLKNIMFGKEFGEDKTYEDQYEEFLENIFGCTRVSVEGDLVEEFEANFVPFDQIQAYCKREVSQINNVNCCLIIL